MNILNRELRDWSAETLYPFEDSASMTGSQGVKIPPSMFLDGLVYSLQDRVLPFYIYSMDGTKGDESEMEIVIRDKANREVCRGILNVSEDTAYLYDSYGRLSGTLVYNPEEAKKVVYLLQGKTSVFSSTDLPLLCGRCFVTTSKGLSIIKGGGESFSPDVCIVAANGIHFTEDSGTVYIHMLGEEPLVNKPIKTINGRAMQHMWLAAHPNSAVKVETKGSGLKIWKISDVQ